MFTGIVQAIGEVRAITPRGGDVELLIACARVSVWKSSRSATASA